MKIKWFSRVFAVVMVLTMLMVSCLSTAALTVTAPEVPEANDNAYAFSFEDGVLTIKVNPDKIYNMLRDGDVSRDELLEFIPEDILETMAQGRELSLDDLRALVANYITVDDLKAIVDELPTDIVREYFDLDMLPDLYLADEIIDLIPIDDMLAAVDADAIKPLINDEVIEILLANQQLKDAVTDEAYVTNLIENTTLVDDLLADPATKAAILDLADDGVIEAIVNDYKDELMKLANDPEIVKQIIEIEGMMETVQEYMTSDEHSAEFDAFINDEDVYNALIEMDSVKDFLFSAEVINILTSGADPLLDKDVISTVFEGKIDMLVTDAVVEYLIADEAFLNGVFSNSALLDDIFTDSLVAQISDGGYIDHLVVPEDVLAMVNLDEALTKLGITVDQLFNDCVDPADYMDIYAAYGLDFTAQELLDGGFVTLDQVIAEYGITAHVIFDKDILETQDIRGFVGDDKIKEVILNNSEVREILKDSLDANPNVDVNDYWPYVNFQELVGVVGAANIGQMFADDDTLFDKLLAEVSPSEIFDAIGMDKCQDVVAENAEALIDVIGVDVVTEHYPNIVDDVMSEVGYKTLIDEEIVTVEEVADIIGYSNLFDYFDTQEIIDTIGFSNIIEYVDIVELIDSLGGVQTVAGYYSTDEIKAIAGAVDKDALASFIKNELLASVDVKALAKDIIDFAYDRYVDFKEFTKVVAKQTAKIFLTEVDYLAINGTNFYEYGMFDLNVLLNELLSALPDFDTFIQLGEDDVAASFDVAISIRGTEYKSGMAVGYLGDPTNLNNLLASKSHLFKLDVSDENVIKVETHTPDVLSDIYRELIESDRLPVSLRNKLAILPTLSIDEALTFVQELPYDELQAIVDALEGKLDPIKDKAYDKIDAAYDKVTGVSAIDSRLPESIENKVEAAIKASQEKVDAIIDAFTDVSKLEAAVDKTAAAIRSNLPASLKNGTLVDLYNENGNFTAGAAVTVDVFELANKIVTLPEELQLFLMSTEVSFGVAYDVTVEGLYKVEIMGADGSVSEAILPAGLEVAKLAELPAFAEIANGLVDENLNPILYIPENDVKAYSSELYSVQFVADGTVLDTIFYPYGTDSVKAPVIPAEYEKLGYTVAWESYSLNQVKRLVVELEYKAIEYTATFMADGEIVDTVKFTVEDDTIAEPAVPAKLGYTGVWEDYTLGMEDIVINAIYTANEYTATFKADGVVVGTVTFTVEDDSITEPDVPVKPGYLGAWESYTLGASDIEINAEYTAIQYEAVFKADGAVVETVTFTVEDIDENGQLTVAIPGVPAKVGYTGVWADYFVDVTAPDNVEINAVYTAIEYTATFKADGAVVETVTFTVEDIDDNGQLTVAIPGVPAKAGYTGVWADYFVDVTAPDNVEINAVYTAIEYTATFKADGNTVETVTFTVEDIDENGQLTVAIPTVPAKVGYTGVWADYFVDVTAPDNVEINAVYTAIEYTATFKADGQTVGTVTFTVLNIDQNGKLTGVTIPAVPAKVGYTGAWADYTVDATAPADIIIEAVYTAIEYTATFKADGQTVGTVTFTVLNIDQNGKLTGVTIPAVPAKIGYEGEWGAYTVDAANPGNVEINAVYEAIEYTATFVAGEQSFDVTFTVENIDANGHLTGVTIPAVPAKVGYTGAWADYTIDANAPADITIEAVYTAIEYDAVFKADGQVVATVKYTVENIDANGKLTGVTIPEVPAKVGYDGVWGEYTIDAANPGNIEINAKYTARIYTATFVADGVVVATVGFTVEDASIAEPAVPEKAGFTGKWEAYELIASDITINAIYTPIGDVTISGTDKDDDDTKTPIKDLVDDLAEDGTLWWWILLIIAILIIIAIILFIIFRPKNDDDDKDNTPPAAPVVEEVVEETPEVIVPVVEEVEDVDVAGADALMTDEAAMATVVYKEGGSTEGYKATVNLGAINDAFADGDKVNLETLKAKGLAPAKATRVKILASGHLNKHGLEVEANSFSVQAIKMITLTGGTAVQKK